MQEYLWLTVAKDGRERIGVGKMPTRSEDQEGAWVFSIFMSISVPIGTIAVLTGKQMTWEDEPLKWMPPNRKKGVFLSTK